MHHLALFGDSKRSHELRLEIVSDITKALPHGSGIPLRSSPIFSVQADVKLAVRRLSGFIGALCPRDPYQFISKQPRPTKDRMFFSHGLAAVICIGFNKAELDALVGSAMAELSAFEIWEATPSTVRVVRAHVHEVNYAVYRLADFSKLKKDYVRSFEEIQLSLYEVGRCVSIYMPEQESRFHNIVQSVNDLLNEIVLSHAAVDKGLINAETHTALNQSLSQLIQLNSALSYVVSQATFGAVPILECPCLIATHSLLGVGTSYRGITALASFVESVFQRNPLLDRVANDYAKAPGFDVFTHDFTRYEPEHWREYAKRSASFDIGERPDPQDVASKVAHFSSRLGYSETPFTITAAAQSLHSADSPRWSLLTLSHELLHAHVKGLLSAIFRSPLESLESLPNEEFAPLYQNFVNNSKSPGSIASSAQESLQFAILNFSAALNQSRTAISRMQSEEGEIEVKRVTPETAAKALTWFQGSLRLLEEILVHTLDLRYFYRRDRDLFLVLLWRSWTTVPAVVADLQTYVLRGLVASATLELGDVDSRFDRARLHLLRVLEGIKGNVPANPFMNRAIDFLKNELNTRDLRMLFRPAIYVADLAHIFLSSTAVATEFWSGDENIEPGGENAIPPYMISTGQFKEQPLTNPVALLASRLRDQHVEESETEDRRSSWLLLVLASTGCTQKVQ